MARISQAQIFTLYRAVAAYEGEPFRTLADACNHFSEAIGFQVAPKTFRTTMLECGKSLITHAHFGKHRPRREKNEATDVDALLNAIQNQIGWICRTIGQLQAVDNHLSSRADKTQEDVVKLCRWMQNLSDRQKHIDADIRRLDDAIGSIRDKHAERLEYLEKHSIHHEQRINQLETQARNALEP